MDKEQLLKMKFGEIVKFEPAGPDSRGYLSEIHRVLGGWIYVFSHFRTGHHAVSIGLSSTFVPEEINVNARKWDL